MDQHDLRMTCLRLAAQQHSDPVRAVEAAARFLRFIETGEAPDRSAVQDMVEKLGLKNQNLNPSLKNPPQAMPKQSCTF